MPGLTKAQRTDLEALRVSADEEAALDASRAAREQLYIRCLAGREPTATLLLAGEPLDVLAPTLQVLLGSVDALRARIEALERKIPGLI